MKPVNETEHWWPSQANRECLRCVSEFLPTISLKSLMDIPLKSLLLFKGEMIGRAQWKHDQNITFSRRALVILKSTFGIPANQRPR